MAQILVLGGTAFLGRETARQALARGHQVTCLARGSAPAPDGVRFVVGDRDEEDGLAAVAGQRWDSIIDVTLHPVQARRAVRDLRTRHWVFVSTANVYEPGSGLDESAPRLAPLVGDRMDGMEDYGPAKVACEDIYRDSGVPAVLVRAGLIGGPGDESGRSGYWPWRFANPVGGDGDGGGVKGGGSDEGAEVVAPDDPDYPIALVDVRDLAAWLVHAAEERLAGPFNATGPATTLGTVLTAAARAAGNRARPRPVPPAVLAELGIAAWAGPASLPLWIDDPELRGFATLDTARAQAAGLVTRPLLDTFRDVLVWEGSRHTPRRCGLDDEDERRVLRATQGHAPRP